MIHRDIKPENILYEDSLDNDDDSDNEAEEDETQGAIVEGCHTSYKLPWHLPKILMGQFVLLSLRMQQHQC